MTRLIKIFIGVQHTVKYPRNTNNGTTLQGKHRNTGLGRLAMPRWRSSLLKHYYTYYNLSLPRMESKKLRTNIMLTLKGRIWLKRVYSVCLSRCKDYLALLFYISVR